MNRERLETLGINVRHIGSSGKTTCPKCSHTRKNKKDPCLSVNVITGQYNCHNPGCDFRGTVAKRMENYETPKVYMKPIFNNRTDLSESLVKWFQGRCISQQTLMGMKITEGFTWMPQVSKEVNTVQFNYFRDGELINTKYRDAAKNFKLVSKAELIFYNIDSIKDCDTCIIVEGEIDALSFIEAGILNVVSVPNGASKTSNSKLEYLDNCWQSFEGKKQIIIATDNDDAGRTLRDELARRLGVERCVWVDFGDCKDSNEYLKAHGPEKLSCLINAVKEFPIKGIFTIDDVWGKVYDIYLNGLPSGDQTGDRNFDAHLGIMPGELTMVTGIPGHGKTIYLDQVSLGLCINSGWEFAVFSPESFPMEFYYTRIIKRLLGKKFSRHHINEVELKATKDWLKSKYHLIFPEEEGFDLDVILEKARQLVLRKGIKGLIIDPWNRIESQMPNGYNEGKFIQEQLKKIINFNQRTGVHTFLVAHPTKMPKRADDTGNYVIPNLYSISGSAHFYNMTQNGLTVYRNFTTGKTEVHFQKVKWEHLGQIGMAEYSYCEDNARFFADGADPHENWLKQIVNGASLEMDFWENKREVQPPVDYHLTETGDAPF